MNTATKVTGYVLGLAATLAIAWGAGAALGPENSNEHRDHPGASPQKTQADHGVHASELGRDQ